MKYHKAAGRAKFYERNDGSGIEGQTRLRYFAQKRRFRFVQAYKSHGLSLFVRTFLHIADTGT